MGVLEDIFSQAQTEPTAQVPVSLVTNQPGGEVSYASGLLRYSPARVLGGRFPLRLPEQLSAPETGLDYLFSDRQSQLQEPAPPPGGFSFGHSNPFSVDRADKLGLSIAHTFFGGTFTARFTLLSWGNAQFEVTLTDQSDGVATGMGAGIGAASTGAFYVFSFGTPILPPG